jgi:hypothetical protein
MLVPAGEVAASKGCFCCCGFGFEGPGEKELLISAETRRERRGRRDRLAGVAGVAEEVELLSTPMG